MPVLGAVMNRLNPRDRDAGYGYYYYYGYNKYSTEPDTKISANAQPTN